MYLPTLQIITKQLHLNCFLYKSEIMKKGHEGEYDLFRAVWGKKDIHIGSFKNDEVTIPQASKLMLDRMIRLIPKIAKKTKFLVLDSGFGTVANSIVKEFECRVDCVNIDKDENKVNQKWVEKNSFEKKLFIIENENYEDLPIERDNYNLALAQEIASFVEDKRKLFRGLFGSMVAEGRLIFTDFLEGDKVLTESESKDLFGFHGQLISEKNLEKVTKKNSFQKVFAKDMTDQLQLFYENVISEIEKNRAKVEKKLSKKVVDDHIAIYNSKVKIIKDKKIKWVLHIYQKINV